MKKNNKTEKKATIYKTTIKLINDIKRMTSRINDEKYGKR